MASTFDPLTFLILKFRGRSVVVFRSTCHDYDSILATARANFQTLQHVLYINLVLLASIPGYPDRREAEVSRDIWPSLGDNILKYSESLTIALYSDLQDSEWAYSESKCSLSAASSTVVSPGPTLQPVITGWNDSASHSIPDSSDDSFGFRAKKPVIYLYPPHTLPDVTVQLTLTPSWCFSAVYPSAQGATRPGGGPTDVQSITWALQAEADGRLTEKTTKTDVTYLYWEADVKFGPCLPSPDPSRRTSPIEDIEETFNPSRPSVSPDDSVLLPAHDGKVVDYLDVALKALTLHTEARTSFITYWLRDLRKHKFVALRFISQKSYEKTAQMIISPSPNVVTRVFMLFRGVRPEDVAIWKPAVARAEDSATYWTEVVGVNAVGASDPKLFRVLEWGGMEIES